MSRLLRALLLGLLLRTTLRPKGAQHLTTSDETNTLKMGDREDSEAVFSFLEAIGTKHALYNFNGFWLITYALIML
jgi:hypothetical protein